MTTPSLANGEPQGKPKPVLFFTALPGEGHTYPLITIASSMIKRGYPVVFHGGPQFEGDVVAMGAEFSPIPSMLDPVPDPEAVMAAGQAITDGRLPLFVHGLVNFLYNTMPVRTQLLEDAIVKLKERDPERQIIIVHELCSMNVTPFAYGRPVPKGFSSFPKTIGIGAVNISAPSVDTAPFSMGLPYDTSPACLLRNKELHKLADQGPWLPLFEAAQRAMREAGCTTVPESHPFGTWYAGPDVCFQMCSASMEYPLSDMPPKLRFAGCLPPKVSGSDFKAPSWWGDVLDSAAKEYKKIVFVSQGTAHVDYSQLIVPTMEAFRGRDDILVVATLGIRDATLGDDIDIPENARWTDFLAYDRILPHADVFVCNAGYGSTSHAVTNGTPAVLAGEVLDKKEVTMRAVYAGYAWDLESAAPSVEQIRIGVEAVLGDRRYKERAVELKKENEGMDCMKTIENQIIEFTN
ncbi:putative glycosyltransferase [Mariannaea sp. PMI_226]|nr:putative glycosyltransferase [Mariannaea sp. PMI_226]